jgi:hypothetical protein
MEIHTLAQSQLVTTPPGNFIIDDRERPSVIITVAVAARTFSRLGPIHTGAISFNTDHPENITTRLPSDTVTSKNAGYILTTLIAIKKAQLLKIKRVIFFSKSALITNIITEQLYTESEDTHILIDKLIKLLSQCSRDNLEISAVFCDSRFSGYVDVSTSYTTIHNSQ